MKNFNTQNSSKINDLKIITVEKFIDSRGEIFSSFEPSLEKEVGQFILDKFTISKKNVLRGLHGDKNTKKLIYCPSGKFQLVVADARKNSSTYGNIESFILENFSEKTNIVGIIVPGGCINGHLILSKNAIFYYKWSQEYDINNQVTVKFDDKDLNIKWKINDKNNIILSDRDNNGINFKEVDLS